MANDVLVPAVLDVCADSDYHLPVNFIGKIHRRSCIGSTSQDVAVFLSAISWSYAIHASNSELQLSSSGGPRLLTFKLRPTLATTLWPIIHRD